MQGEAALRELAARLLAPPDSYDQATMPPRILVGRLPENLPVEIPVPDGLTVVGSIVRDMPRRNGRMIDVVLDADVPAELFRETYRQLLLTSGWDEDQERPGRSGFVPRGLPGLFHRAATRFSRLRRLLGERVPGLPRDIVGFFRLGG